MCERLLADALYARAFHYSIVPMMSLADDVILVSNFIQRTSQPLPALKHGNPNIVIAIFSLFVRLKHRAESKLL